MERGGACSERGRDLVCGVSSRNPNHHSGELGPRPCAPRAVCGQFPGKWEGLELMRTALGKGH